MLYLAILLTGKLNPFVSIFIAVFASALLIVLGRIILLSGNVYLKACEFKTVEGKCEFLTPGTWTGVQSKALEKIASPFQ